MKHNLARLSSKVSKILARPAVLQGGSVVVLSGAVVVVVRVTGTTDCSGSTAGTIDGTKIV